MTAKEMFEKLGFKKYKNKWDKETEKDWGKDCFIRYKTKDIEIIFDNLDCDYCVYGTGICRNVGVDIELHKAINKQVEELGWLGSDKE